MCMNKHTLVPINLHEALEGETAVTAPEEPLKMPRWRGRSPKPLLLWAKAADLTQQKTSLTDRPPPNEVLELGLSSPSHCDSPSFSTRSYCSATSPTAHFTVHLWYHAVLSLHSAPNFFLLLLIFLLSYLLFSPQGLCNADSHLLR